MRATSTTAVILALAAILATVLLGTGPAHAGERVQGEVPSAPTAAELGDLSPENTVILSSEADRDFCQDFSVLLGDLSPEWSTLTGDEIPPALQGRNLLLIGRLDSEYTGGIIRELLIQEEAAALREGGQATIVKANPWAENRVVVIAAGADRLLTKAAAERAVNQIIEATGARAAWYRSAASDDREAIKAFITRYQHRPANDDPPIEALGIDVDAKPPRRITAGEAAEDVEYLFSLLSHGWCGYGYFSTLGDFDAARADILAALADQAHWSPDDLSALLREELDFIHDCHMNIQGTPYCRHLDFWYDRDLDVRRAADGYTFMADGVEHRVTTINGRPPADYLFPSLNREGEPVYRIGVLARSEPEPLRLAAETAAGRAEFEITLAHTDYQFSDRFGEERIGGVPVLRARSFADYYSDELGRFIDAGGAYRDEPYLIVDIRGNGGGNTRWPQGWISRFTGRSPSLKHALTELTSRTSMMGRANLFAEMLAGYPEEDAAWIGAEIDRYEQSARQFDNLAAAPYWTPLEIPLVRFIPNDTTLIVLVDGSVASAGEGLLSYLHAQVENVVIVGENSRGAVTFGQVSAHRLPHSQLHVTLPIKLNAMMDMTWREEQGYLPHLWVPAGEALNYAVAAVRAGTIGTMIEIPPGYFDVTFRRERVRGPGFITENRDLIAIGGLVILGLGVMVILRKRRPPLVLLGAGAMVLGTTMVIDGNPVGYFLLLYGVTSLAIGVARWWKSKRPTSGEA
jgi:hypothetical protein